MIPIITIEGPTASGKTTLAIELAQFFETEIISADSRQVYKYLDIGTAKPTNKELATVKHHMIDIIEPNESFNAGLFYKQAMAIIEGLYANGKIPIICGGTGLYIKALLEGLFHCEESDKCIRADLEKEFAVKGLSNLYDELMLIDPISAQSISFNDKQRILRALEVYRATGLPLSRHWQNQKKDKMLNPFRILLEDDRASLYHRIDERVINMLDTGLLKEIESLLLMGYKWTDCGFNSVGYKEFKPYYDKIENLNDCTLKAQQHTRNYAKRQITWYNKCTFNLTEHYPSIILFNVGEMIKSYFDKKKPEEFNGHCSKSL